MQRKTDSISLMLSNSISDDNKYFSWGKVSEMPLFRNIELNINERQNVYESVIFSHIDLVNILVVQYHEYI